MRKLRAVILFMALAVPAACDLGTGPTEPQRLPVAFTVVASSSVGANENDALGRAFDKVDSYAIVVRDSLTRELYADTTVAISAGLATHTLAINMPKRAIGRILTIRVVAYDGGMELFRSAADASLLDESVTTVEVPVRYTGPGLRGSVADLAGAGLGGVTVSLLRDGAVEEEATTSSDGSYLFIDLTPGTYVVRPGVSAGQQACPGERQVTLGNIGESLVAAFVLRSGTCNVRVLVISGGDVDDTGAAAAELAGDPEIEVSTFFFVNALPSLDRLKQADVVLLYSNGLFDESKRLGDVVTDFVSLGGNVVFGSFYWQVRTGSGKQTTGWGALEGSDPFASAGGAVYTSGSLGDLSPHVLTDGLDVLTSTSGYRGGVSARGGTTVVGSWNDGSPLVGYRTLAAGQRMVGVSLFPAHAAVGGVSGDTGRLWKNAVKFAGAAGGPARVGVVVGGR